MVQDGVSSLRIRNYLSAWARWWTRTEESWDYDELLMQFINTCRHPTANHYAIGLIAQQSIKGQQQQHRPTLAIAVQGSAMLEARF